MVDRIELGEPPDHDPTTPSVLGVIVFESRRSRPTMLAWVHPHGRWIDWRRRFLMTLNAPEAYSTQSERGRRTHVMP